jgi:hypothetical protein
MKIRSDFVTNSSSSSFVIGVKEELTREKLYKIFQVSEDHPLRDIPDTILENVEKITEDEFVKEHSNAVEHGDYQDILGKGYLLYNGYAPDYGSPAEGYLFNLYKLNVPEEEFLLLNSAY